MCASYGQHPAAAAAVYDPDFGGTVQLQTVDRQPNATDDQLTAQTIGILADQAKTDSKNPLIRQATADALRHAGMSSASADADKCAALWQYAKGRIRYVREADLEGPFNLQLDRELDQMLIPPSVLLRMPDPKGDCPHFSALIAAMLRVLGIGSSYKTIAADPSQPNAYSHIYNVAHTRQGDIPVDASNMPAPNTEYQGRVTKAKVWPIDKKQAPPATLAGLGDTIDSVDLTNSGGFWSTTDSSTDSGSDGSGFNWGGFASDITKNIAAPILKAQYAVPNIPKGTTFQQRNADGSITQISSAPAGAVSPFGSLGTTGSSSTYLLLAAAAAAVILLSKK